MNNNRNFVRIGIAVLAIVIIGGGIYLQSTGKVNFKSVLGMSKTQAPADVVPVQDTGVATTATAAVSSTRSVASAKTVPVATDAETSAAAAADADMASDVVTTDSCGTTGCFDKKFALCQPATETAVAGTIGTYQAQIVGPVPGGCSVTTEYLKYAFNSNWENKPMTCTYDNTLSLKDATPKVFNGIIDGSVQCTGPLYAVIRAEAAQQ